MKGHIWHQNSQSAKWVKSLLVPLFMTEFKFIHLETHTNETFFHLRSHFSTISIPASSCITFTAQPSINDSSPIHSNISWKKIKYFVMLSNPKLLLFYHLPKVCKSATNPLGRWIITDSLTSPLSYWQVFIEICGTAGFISERIWLAW